MRSDPRHGDCADPLAQVRQRAHQILDTWIDGLAPLLSGDKPPTLAQLSGHMSETRAQLLGGCLQAVLDHIQANYADLRRISCPCCGRVLYRKRMESKDLSTLHGQAQLSRPYFYCADCHQGFHPLDEALELAREVHQYDVQQELAQLAAELPYSCAAQQLRRLTGIAVGEHAFHDHVNRIAEQIRIEDVIPLRSEIQRRIERARPPNGELPVLVGGLRRMQPNDNAAGEEIAKLSEYLEEHRDRVDYNECTEQGLPRGSGGIESANKFLVHARLKRSGAWWLEPNGNGMLRLRCAIYNGTFDRVFKKYVANRRKKSSI